MRCPNCNTFWHWFNGASSSTNVVGSCSKCGSIYAADVLTLYKDKEKKDADKSKRH